VRFSFDPLMMARHAHHSDFAGAERPNAALRDQLDSMLNRWRELLPPQLQWREDDPPALDINDARLRAKFYGAQYIIHRPFLRLVLDREVLDRETKSPPHNSFTPLNERHSGLMAPPRPNIDREVPADIYRSAQICVKAAMHSTTAFDSIINHRRLVVTNIFGTAHAYVFFTIFGGAYCIAFYQIFNDQVWTLTTMIGNSGMSWSSRLRIGLAVFTI
jgi:hypothetical protein